MPELLGPRHLVPRLVVAWMSAAATLSGCASAGGAADQTDDGLPGQSGAADVAVQDALAIGADVDADAPGQDADAPGPGGPELPQWTATCGADQVERPGEGCVAVGLTGCADVFRDAGSGVCRPRMAHCPSGHALALDEGCVPVGPAGCAERFVDPMDAVCRADSATCGPGLLPRLDAGCVSVGPTGCAPELRDSDTGLCAPGAERCGDTELLVPGEGCRPLEGLEGCGPAPWPAVPEGATVVHVDPAFDGHGASGTSSAPWTSLSAALTAAPDGAFIALAAGSYVGAEIARPLHLVGTCASEVTVGPAPGAAATFTFHSGAQASLSGVRVSGPAIGVLVGLGASLLWSVVHAEPYRGEAAVLHLALETSGSGQEADELTEGLTTIASRIAAAVALERGALVTPLSTSQVAVFGLDASSVSPAEMALDAGLRARDAVVALETDPSTPPGFSASVRLAVDIGPVVVARAGQGGALLLRGAVWDRAGAVASQASLGALVASRAALRRVRGVYDLAPGDHAASATEVLGRKAIARGFAPRTCAACRSRSSGGTPSSRG